MGLFKGKVARASIQDAVLGTLHPEDDGWRTDLKDGGGFSFEIGGRDSPDAALLSHAHEIHRESASFTESIRAFLVLEKDKFHSEFHGEIDSLSIERVVLWWPDRPDDGMVYFLGGQEGRVWRCDYAGRKPKGLGFDS